jgi:hypothetical protein
MIFGIILRVNLYLGNLIKQEHTEQSVLFSYVKPTLPFLFLSVTIRLRLL